jgi:hypothetical protein
MLDILTELYAWNAEEFLKLMVPAIHKETERLSAKSTDG